MLVFRETFPEVYKHEADPWTSVEASFTTNNTVPADDGHRHSESHTLGVVVRGFNGAVACFRC